MECRIIITTYSDKLNAEKIARDSIEANLAACINIIKVRSIYTWKGKIEEMDEFLTLFKTTEKGVNRLKDFIRKNHTYEVPEIIEITPQYIDPKYLLWLTENVSAR
ncbi:MAG: divalent-cation tolerance protein CutA [Candidatus Methylarchaceae archaeon HK02M2]|nr:divalent-cation tolerance protein CutA [Candidatus Methylarchaceae archaeon HK02M2]